MKESGYYPPGVEFDPSAPWNENNEDNEKIDTKVCVSTTLSKTTIIPIENVIVSRELECEANDEGGIDKYEMVEYDYSESNLIEDYKFEEYTILELLSILKKYIENDLKLNKSNLSISTLQDKYKLNKILKSINGWVEDELEVIQED